MTVEVVDQPITNLFRLISKTYKINIVPAAELSEMQVTINLENITVREGLRHICNINGLEMNEVGDVIYIQKASEKTRHEIDLHSKRIDINVENQPVKEFIKAFAEKTKISIVPGQNLEGKVTGHLKNVLPIDGFKALMAANQLNVRHKSGILLVEGKDESSDTHRPRIRRRGGSPGQSGPVDLDVNDGKVTASLRGANLQDVLRSITDQAELNLVVYGEINQSIDAELKDVPINTALSVFLQGTKFTYIIKEGMILIGESNPKTASGAILSTVDLHHLKYMRAKEAHALIPKSLAEGVKVVKEQNAVLITGTAERITRIKEFMEQIDLPVPQVLIEVVIVEYERSRTSELGVEVGRPSVVGPSLGAEINIDGIKMVAKEKFGSNIFSAATSFLSQNWQIHLKSMLEKKNGKILAMPKITTLNGNKAHLRVRKTQYHPITHFNPQGMPATDFRAIDDGITIDLTPWVTRHGDVNLEIKPSIKTSGIPTSANSPAPVTDRAVTTNVRLLDGETLILGGLIDSKDKNTRSFVPILGHIPIIGYLFSSRAKSKSTTEMVIFVTPHILSDEDLSTDLGQELDALDHRSGFIKDKDFTGKAADKVETVPSDVNTNLDTKPNASNDGEELSKEAEKPEADPSNTTTIPKEAPKKK